MGCTVIKSFTSGWVPSLPGTIFTRAGGIHPVLPKKQAGELNANLIIGSVLWFRGDSERNSVKRKQCLRKYILSKRLYQVAYIY